MQLLLLLLFISWAGRDWWRSHHTTERVFSLSLSLFCMISPAHHKNNNNKQKERKKEIEWRRPGRRSITHDDGRLHHITHIDTHCSITVSYLFSVANIRKKKRIVVLNLKKKQRRVVKTKRRRCNLFLAAAVPFSFIPIYHRRLYSAMPCGGGGGATIAWCWWW